VIVHSGLKSESDLSACYAQAGAEIAENSHLWMDPIYGWMDLFNFYKRQA